MKTGPQMNMRSLTVIFFTGLLAALTLFYASSFSSPPRSDYWSAFYVFQQVRESPGPPGWTSILTFDLWKHGTYRPLSHFLLYLEHLLFSTHFVGNHLLNFSMYCLSVILLYLLSRKLGAGRLLSAAFISVYAFFYTHFDIVTWTFQLFSTSSFCAFLAGFILYLKFLENKSSLLLIPTGCLFLFGLLCSEVYLFWPTAIILLGFIHRGREARSGQTSFAWSKPTAFLLTAIYLIYLIGFYIHRSAPQTTGAVPGIEPFRLLVGVTSVFFNFIYNSILANLAPVINTPANFYHNIEMGGLLVEWENCLVPIVISVGIAGIAAAFFLFRQLQRRKENNLFLLLLFPSWLYFSYFLVLSLARQSTDHISYTLAQFRYQYVPNAMAVMLVLLGASLVLRPSRKEKILVCLGLIPILLANIFFISLTRREIRRQLDPLRGILNDIESGIERGTITADRPLYISPDFAASLPRLCWNPDMGQFMEGSYRWLFPPETMNCFTSDRRQAGSLIRAGEQRIRFLSRPDK